MENNHQNDELAPILHSAKGKAPIQPRPLLRPYSFPRACAVGWPSLLCSLACSMHLLFSNCSPSPAPALKVLLIL